MALVRESEGKMTTRSGRRYSSQGAAMLVLGLAVLAACGKPAPQGPGPEVTVKGFYDTYLAVHPMGIPEEVQLSKLAPFLTPTLIALLRDADAAETTHRKKTHNEQPPLVEGDLFTSMFEGASSFVVLPAQVKGDRATCEVQFIYKDPNPKYTVVWKDEIFLVKGASGWLIDDIEFLGDWQFMHKGRLRGLLAQVVKDGAALP